MSQPLSPGGRRLRAGALALVVLSAAGCGEQDPHRRAALWVLDTGGRLGVLVEGNQRTVTERSELPEGAFDVVRVGWQEYPADTFPDVTDERLERLAVFSRLTHLDLSGTAVTDAGLSRLPRFEHLTHLYLNETAVTAAGLESLSDCRNLAELGLVGVPVTPEAAQRLRREFPGLKIHR